MDASLRAEPPSTDGGVSFLCAVVSNPPERPCCWRPRLGDCNGTQERNLETAPTEGGAPGPRTGSLGHRSVQGAPGVPVWCSECSRMAFLAFTCTEHPNPPATSAK